MFETPTMSTPDEEVSRIPAVENNEALSPGDRVLDIKVTTFEQLEKVLESIGEFPGSRKSYSFAEIIPLINEARETGDISHLPRTYNIREKVGDLLIAEAQAK